jgi:micrococcal nuclease
MMHARWNSPAPLALALLGLCLVPAGARAQTEFRARVTQVFDGDTVAVWRDGAEVKIRLEGVDCPEKSQPFGEEAKDFTTRTVLHKTVLVRVATTDVYGRLVARVEYRGADLSRALLREGLAWHFKRYNRERELADLQEAAREAAVGLWSQRRPQPPWEYRREQKGDGD